MLLFFWKKKITIKAKFANTINIRSSETFNKSSVCAISLNQKKKLLLKQTEVGWLTPGRKTHHFQHHIFWEIIASYRNSPLEVRVPWGRQYLFRNESLN